MCKMVVKDRVCLVREEFNTFVELGICLYDLSFFFHFCAVLTLSVE